MPNPKNWLQRSETIMTIGAFLIVAIAFAVSRLFGT